MKRIINNNKQLLLDNAAEIIANRGRQLNVTTITGVKINPLNLIHKDLGKSKDKKYRNAQRSTIDFFASIRPHLCRWKNIKETERIK